MVDGMSRSSSRERRALLTNKRDRHRYNASTESSDHHDDGATHENQQQHAVHEHRSVCRILAAYYSFIVVGAFDGSYGPLNSVLRTHYHLTYLSVSFALLSPVLGYILAAFLNDRIHRHSGQRGIAALTSLFHILSALIASRRPPYTTFVFSCFLSGLGNGIADASWNAWIGAMERSNGLMGMLHGFYGVGAALAPLAFTTVVDWLSGEWCEFYYVMLVGAAIEFATTVAAFWKESGDVYCKGHDQTTGAGQQDAPDGSGSRGKGSDSILKEALRVRTTWLLCMFVFLYAGIEIGLADWVASYLIDVGGFPRETAGLITFGYWGGLTIGRTMVGFIASTFASGKATVYICLAVTILAWLVFTFAEDVPLSAMSIVIYAFFLGPLFPEAVILQAKLLPAHLHLASIGFVCAFGSAGGGVFRFLLGSLAESFGITVILPFAPAMLAACLVCWSCLRQP